MVTGKLLPTCSQSWRLLLPLIYSQVAQKKPKLSCVCAHSMGCRDERGSTPDTGFQSFGLVCRPYRLAAGSTRFCAGILSTARHLSIEQKMADYSNKLYHQLEQETGIQTGRQVTYHLLICSPPVFFPSVLC